MTKAEIEFHIFGEEIEQLDCVESVDVNRQEIEAELNCINEDWGMPTELANKLQDNDSGNEWCIVDFSHVFQKESGGCGITVYLQPR